MKRKLKRRLIELGINIQKKKGGKYSSIYFNKMKIYDSMNKIMEEMLLIKALFVNP